MDTYFLIWCVFWAAAGIALTTFVAQESKNRLRRQISSLEDKIMSRDDSINIQREKITQINKLYADAMSTISEAHTVTNELVKTMEVRRENSKAGPKIRQELDKEINEHLHKLMVTTSPKKD